MITDDIQCQFPPKKNKIKTGQQKLVKTGIKASCNNKRKLYLLCRESNDPKLKKHYKNIANY
jgi:hypothetical protein